MPEGAAANPASARKPRTAAPVPEQESAILAAAAAVFARDGVGRTSMDEVAKTASVSRSTLYRRFPNKDVLLLAVAADTCERGLRRLEAAVVGLGPREAVVEAFAVGAEMVHSDPLLRRMVLEDMQVRGVTATLTAVFVATVTQRIAATLRAAGAAMPDDDLHQAVELHVRLVKSYLEIPSADEHRRTPEYCRHLAATFLAPMIH